MEGIDINLPQPYGKEEQFDCAMAVASGDRKAYENFIKHNLRLVKFFANQYAPNRKSEPCDYDIDDVFNAGAMGLVKATDKIANGAFDVEKYFNNLQKT